MQGMREGKVIKNILTVCLALFIGVVMVFITIYMAERQAFKDANPVVIAGDGVKCYRDTQYIREDKREIIECRKDNGTLREMWMNYNYESYKKRGGL